MWKRRASYDPMKAAAEDRKKKEEAKRQVQQSKLSERFAMLIAFCIVLKYSYSYMYFSF